MLVGKLYLYWLRFLDFIIVNILQSFYDLEQCNYGVELGVLRCGGEIFQRVFQLLFVWLFLMRYLGYRLSFVVENKQSKLSNV